MNYKQQLEQLRKDINQTDIELINAVAKRVAVVKKIGDLKRKNGVKPLDKSRWQKVIAKVSNLAKDHNLDLNPICEMYEIIHNYSLNLESSSSSSSIVGDIGVSNKK